MLIDTSPNTAHATLDLLLEAVLEEPGTYATHGGPDTARTCITTLRGVLDAPPATNPEYIPQPQMAAALIALHVLDADTWHALARGAVHGGDEPTGTLKGLVALANIVGLVGDDHDLSLDPDAPTPTLVPQDSLPSFAPTVSPRSLLAALTAANVPA